jgi:hypothetical protein
VGEASGLASATQDVDSIREGGVVACSRSAILFPAQSHAIGRL